MRVYDNVSERGFYELDLERNGIWADQIISALLKIFHPKTAIDIGCGGGFYTKQFIDNGVDCVGYDGCPHTFEMTNGLCSVRDFSYPVDVGKFDMVFSLEVGEHIPAEFEDVYIGNLITAAKNTICLSWSPRIGEPVGGHVNCQKNEWVIDKMNKLGWVLDDKATKYIRDAVTKWEHFQNSIMIFTKA
jgi:SAM-dependent methyltransferase